MFMKTEEELGKLPKPPSEDAYAEMTTLVGEFVLDVKQLVEGQPGAENLFQQLLRKQVAFCDLIRSTAPDFRPYLSDDDDRVAMDFLEIEEADTTDHGQVFRIKEVRERIEKWVNSDLARATQAHVYLALALARVSYLETSHSSSRASSSATQEKTGGATASITSMMRMPSSQHI